MRRPPRTGDDPRPDPLSSIELLVAALLTKPAVQPVRTEDGRRATAGNATRRGDRAHDPRR